MWEYFTREELMCRCGCGGMEMDPYFMDKLHSLRKALGFPLTVSSGYRCPDYNKRISKSGYNGPHTTGRAVDIAISGGDALKLIQYACNFHLLGIGVKQSGPHEKRYIHIDDLTEKDGYPRPGVWSY